MNYIKKNIKKILFATIVIVLFILIGITSKGRENISSTENVIGVIISRTQKVAFNIGHTFSNAFISVQNITKIKKENNVLREKLYELQEKNRILEDITYNSEILENEYKLRMNLEYDYVEAQVISKDNGNWFERFVIDKGEKDGIKKDDIVIQAVKIDDKLVTIGLVGKIVDIGYNWSKVITLLDENSKVSFRLIENNESGIIEGNIEGTIAGYFFNNHNNAEEGDKLVTSGLGETYIKDIYIGLVSKVEKTTDAMAFKIYVDPAIDFSKLYKVFVLKVER